MKKDHTISQKNSVVQYDDFWETFGRSRQDLHWPEIDTLLEDLLSDFSPTTGAVADIGCGNGRLLKHIMKHSQSDVYKNIFRAYVWLDTSWVLLNQARADEALVAFFPSTNWREGDMRDLASELSEYGFFDAIFFIASFHHLATREERISVLQQAKKLLSKTGKILMMNWNLQGPAQEKHQGSKIADYPDGSSDYEIKIGSHTRFYHAFSEAEYTSLAEETGLQASLQFGERNSIALWY